jgi:hypothetical protein
MKAIPQCHRIELSEDEREDLLTFLDWVLTLKNAAKRVPARDTAEELYHCLVECDGEEYEV